MRLLTSALILWTLLPSIHAQGPEGFFEVEGRVEAPCPGAFGLTLSRDGRRIFFGGGFNEQPDVWTAEIDEVTREFLDCRPLSEINSTAWDVPGSLSADGSELFFESTRRAEGAFVNSIFSARWDPALDSFAAPHLVDLGSPENGRVYRPGLSRDGYELFFNAGGGDRSPINMYVAWRYRLDEPFVPENTRRLEITSVCNDFAPVLASDGRTLLWTGWRTNSHECGPDYSESNVWMATRSEPFDPEIHDEPPRFADVCKVPSDTPDTYFIDISIGDRWPEDGSKVYFISCPPGQCTPGSPYAIYSATWRSTESTPRFRRGDCNSDGTVDVADAVYALNWLFAGAQNPGCLAALNTNGDDAVNLADPVALLNFLFGGGAAPVAPYPTCGVRAGEDCAAPPENCG